MPELLRDPAHGLARTECQSRPGVTRTVELERTDSFLLCSPPEPLPYARDVAFIQRSSHLRAEHRLRNFAPATVESLYTSLCEQIEEAGGKSLGESNGSTAAALGRRRLAVRDGASDAQGAAFSMTLSKNDTSS